MKPDVEKLKKDKSTEELLEFGIINIDKSSGPTSFDTSNFVKEKLGLRKTSHFGTLDPKVTGVLPVALNRGCKLTGFFIGEDKEYVGIMRFHEEVKIENVKTAIEKEFSGIITQLPPVKSRVKRAEREREIKDFELIEKEEKDILFRVECEGGTYIRKLVHDLGQELKTGAHMLELRRIRAGIFNEFDEIYPSVNLFDFEKAVEEYKKGNDELLRKIIIPGEIVSELYPSVEVVSEFVDKALHGAPLQQEWLENPQNKELQGKFCAFSKGQLIGIYKVTAEGKIFARPKFVLQPLKKGERK